MLFPAPTHFLTGSLLATALLACQPPPPPITPTQPRGNIGTDPAFAGETQALPPAEPPPTPPPSDAPGPNAGSPFTPLAEPLASDGSHVCERFGRAIPGAQWTYMRKPIEVGSPESNETSGYAVVSYDRATGKLEIAHKRNTNFPENYFETNFVETYRCDEQGQWLLSSIGPTHRVFTRLGSTSDAIQDTRYVQPYLMLPARFEIGARWQAKATMRHIVTEAGKPPQETTMQLDRSCEVVAKERKTVPAGTYDALRVECMAVGATTKERSWYVDGIGLIAHADPGSKLMTHTPAP